MLQEVSTQDWLGDLSFDENPSECSRSLRTSVSKQVPYIAIVVWLTAGKPEPRQLTL